MSPNLLLPRASRSPLACLTLALTLTALAGCGGCQQKQPSAPPGSTPAASAGANSGAKSSDTSPPDTSPPSTSSALPPASAVAPAIHALGPEGVLPKELVLEFPRSLFPEGSEPGQGTAYTLEPALPGRLSTRGTSTLVFTPARPFAPGTRYTFSLTALELPEGTLKPPAQGAWSHSFSTPAFSFLRLAPREFNLRQGRIKVELLFSGPVELAAVRRLASFQVAGQPISEVKLATTSEPHVLSATLVHPQLKPAATLRFQLKQGAAAAGSRDTAPAAQEQLELRGGKRLDITAAFVREGNTGHYLELRCSDAEAEAPEPRQEDEEEHYYYDYGVDPRRCMLEASEAADAIRFKPAATLSVSPTRRGFRIFGDFKRGTYSMRIAAGTTSVGGGTLMATYEKTFSIPARQPQLSFASTGRYLPRGAWRNLPLNHLNLDSVALTVRHVPVENLVFWMSEEGNEAATERTSNVLAKTTLALKGAEDTLATTYVDVASLVPANTRGLVEISATGGSRSAASRILLTRLSLVAKRSPASLEGKLPEEVRVWALDIDSTEPLSGVEVSLLKKSGQAVARCTTSGVQGCRLEVPAAGVDTAEPFALLARQGEELTYLKYSELRADLAGFSVFGEPFRSEQAYRATLYSDRGVYRPGEVAHVVAVLRTQEDSAPPASMPVELEVVDPRERSLKKLTLKTNEAGLVSLDVPFEAYQDTGRHTVKLRVGGREVARHDFNVEEFVPERMKVTARTEREGYLQGEEVPVGVQAAYLFGGSAQGSPVQATCRLEPASFTPEQNAQYTYGPWKQAAAKEAVLGQVEAALDDQGQAMVRCPALQQAGGFKGMAWLVARVGVLEAGSGRSTAGVARVPVHPEPYYLGLQANADKVERGKPFTVSGVVVDWKGAPYAKAVPPLEVEYLRLEEEYGLVYDEEQGEETYQRFLRPVREGRSTLKAEGGRFSLQVTPGEDAAGYLVRVKAGQAQTDLQLEGQGRYYWWYGDSSRVDQTPRPAKATVLRLELPKSARVGKAVPVKLKVPYRGRVLFTVETDRVVTADWVAVGPGEVSWSFTPSAFTPNVYVSAFLVKDPHLESAEAFMPDRAFGVASVSLEPQALTQQVRLQVPQEVRSSSTLEVGLELGELEGPTFATVAVVDEGILSLTGFESPDPLSRLVSRRALGVETYETLGWTLLVPPAGASSTTGGGDEGGAEGRVQPVKPVALWSGVLPVPANGRLKVPFALPQYRGAVRVMAVTVGPKRIGHASAEVKVRDPLVLQTTLPRFLTQGDEIQIPVFLTNLSGRPQEVQVSLAAESLPVPGLEASASMPSPLELLGKSEGKVRLEEGKSATLVFQARAVLAVGAARLKVVAKGEGYTATDQLDVPFLPAGPRERLVQRIELAEGTLDLAPYLKGWVPTSERSTFWVTTNPYAESFQHLGHLLRYPYGCIEQTTSSTRPLLFVSGLIDSVDPTLVASGKLEDMVMSGVRRVLSMQTAEGGFGYWPGATEPVAWGTAYATHLLLDARKLKYPVPEDRVEEALGWMSQVLDKGHASMRWEYHRDAQAYMHYVLALAGKGHKARAQKLLEELPGRRELSKGELAEQQYLVKAALWLAGDRRYEKELRSPDLSPVVDERRNGWAFYSDRRRRGMMLSTFQDLFGNDAAGEPLAQLVASALHEPRSGWYTTQELVWGITGLGKRVAGAASSFTEPVLSVEGKAVATKDLKGRSSDHAWALARASERKGVALKVDKKGEGKLYLLLASEGVREGAQHRYGGQGLRVKRRFRKLDGTELDVRSTALPLAELVYVEVEVTNSTAERMQNVALVDRLPAGWEIENARLGRGGAVGWVDPEQVWSPDYVNIRDDRMEVFGALEAGQTKKVVYAVRAVTAGRFTLPPVEAEAMYDPRQWAREAGGSVQVEGGWKDNLL